MKIYHQFCKAINKVLEVLAMALLAVMVLSLVLQVLTRFVLNNPASWTEAVARYAFIWVIMMGCSMCVSNGSHATVTLLNDHLHGGVKKAHQIIIELFVIACAAVLLKEALTLIPKTQRSIIPVLNIPMSWIYAALPVGMAGTIVNSIDHILTIVFQKEEGEKA